MTATPGTLSGPGSIIAFMGLPGAGKSTTARELSRLIGDSLLFQEPEDSEWPSAVQRRHEFGYFGALSWFRSMRVPLLFMADQARRDGKTAIVDSYYDKLIRHYIEHPNMSWLIPATDPYYPSLLEIADLDTRLLPNVDCLVFLELTPPIWHHFLSTRERAMDLESGFLNSFSTQTPFLNASKEYAARTGAHLLIIEQVVRTPTETAAAILQQVRELGLLQSNAQ